MLTEVLEKKIKGRRAGSYFGTAHCSWKKELHRGREEPRRGGNWNAKLGLMEKPSF